jgi:hypothetical protein
MVSDSKLVGKMMKADPTKVDAILELDTRTDRETNAATVGAAAAAQNRDLNNRGRINRDVVSALKSSLKEYIKEEKG